jgi:hypothetical protein
MVAHNLRHRPDRLGADSLAEPLPADDDHQRRGGGWSRALAKAGNTILEHRVEPAVGEGMRVPVPADRDTVADRRERASSLVEQGELIIGRQLIEEPREGSHHRVVVEELRPR